MPLYDDGLPAGVAAFGGGLAEGNPFTNVFGSVVGSAPQGDSFNKVVEVLELENALSTARTRQRKLQLAEEEAARDERRRAAAVKLAPPGLEAIADYDPGLVLNRVVEQAMPDAPSPSDRYRVVGNQLYDISGAQPQLAASAPRAPGRPMPVYDAASGQVTYVPPAEAVGQAPPPKQGITVSPDGTVQIGGQATPLGKRAQGELELNLINANEKIGRLNEIAARFDPRFLQIGEQLWQKKAAIQDKLGLLGPDQQAALADYAGFKQSAFNDLNQTLKEMSGAAVTPQEAERQLLVLPNPGKGVFDGDSPAVFQRKLQNTIEFTKKAQARMHYIRTYGLDAGSDFAGIKLDDMPGIIDARAAELEKQYGGQGLSEPQVEQVVEEQLRREFGI